jgi:hypothetical protein
VTAAVEFSVVAAAVVKVKDYVTAPRMKKGRTQEG